MGRRQPDEGEHRHDAVVEEGVAVPDGRAHEAGCVRVTEARAADFFGPGVTHNGQLGSRVIPKLSAGKAVGVIGDPTTRRCWTCLSDIARALAVLGTDDRSWGRAWHVPACAPVSVADMVARLAGHAGVAPPKVKAMPRPLLRVAGVFSPVVRELPEIFYQFERDFVVDSSACTRTFGLCPTLMDEALADTVAWWRHRVPVAA